jgi:anthranilate phosphoribosyltransferase
MRSLVRTIESTPGPPVVSVAGGFDGKLRTFNVGAAASLVAAAAGGRVMMLGCQGTPPKAGRTVFDALLDLGIPSPRTLREAEASLNEHGFAATTVKHYLPELHALLELRWEMARRTVLSVAEKMVSPAPGSRFLVGVTHRPFLESVARALVDLRVEHALVVQSIEGSDEAPLDGRSALVRVRGDELEEFRVPPESLGLLKVTRADIVSRGPEHEARCLLGGEEGPVRDLILYNTALRLWVADEAVPLAEHLESARTALYSGEALELVDRLGGRVPASG